MFHLANTDLPTSLAFIDENRTLERPEWRNQAIAQACAVYSPSSDGK
jgi:hypothetical protein